MFQILVIALALASVNANCCTDPCKCNGLSWEGKFTYLSLINNYIN